jgi:ABC-type transport system substrate-binding protein
LQKSPYLNTEYLGFNLDSTKGNVVPPAVRKAINYCFDREEMVMYMRNNMADPAGKGIVPPSLNQTYSHQLSGYSFDRDYARQLLAEHGFAGGYPSTIDLYTTSDYVDICEYIQHSAAQVGIDIKIHLATGASFRNMIANGEAQMFRASWIADYPDAENYLSLFYSPNKSPQGPNYTRFSHTVYDSLYKKALNETNHEKQAAIYRQMESIIIGNAPVVPLYAIFPFVNNLTLRLLPTCYERNRRLLAHGNSLSFG